MAKLSLAIPFYNEKKNVEQCLKSHFEALKGIDFEIIAVNNGSTDGTGNILSKLKNKKIKVIHIKKNKGFGNGILNAWSIAKGDYLAYNSGSNQVDAGEVLKAFKKVVNENLDLCVSNRTKEYGFFRKLESWFYNNIFCLIFLGYRFDDVNGYPKVMTKKCFKELNICYKDSFFDTEIMVKALKKKLKIGKIYVKYKKRKKGKSSVKFYTAWEFVKNLIKFRRKMND